MGAGEEKNHEGERIALKAVAKDIEGKKSYNSDQKILSDKRRNFSHFPNQRFTMIDHHLLNSERLNKWRKSYLCLVYIFVLFELIRKKIEISHPPKIRSIKNKISKKHKAEL